MIAAYLSTLLEELASRGIDVERAMDPKVVGGSEDVSAEAFAATLVRAVELTGDPAFGLDFGMRLNLASHGILGYALMSSRDGNQLLSLLTRYARLALPNVHLERIVDGPRLLLTCRPDPASPSRELLTEVALATLVAGARALFDRRIPGAAVWLDYAAPPHARRYDVMKVPVHFAEACSALVCDRQFLDMALPGANPVMAEIGARQCEELVGQMSARTGFAERVRVALLRGNLHAHSKFPDQMAMAARLNVSARTLRRRLDLEGTRYREILDEVRFELAKQYLTASELPVTEIAALLGYDDPANFRRAFKRLSGVPPNTWRQAPC